MPVGNADSIGLHNLPIAVAKWGFEKVFHPLLMREFVRVFAVFGTRFFFETFEPAVFGIVGFHRGKLARARRWNRANASKWARGRISFFVRDTREAQRK